MRSMSPCFFSFLNARRHSARAMDDFEDHIMGKKREEQAVESRVSNGVFQAM